MASGCVRLLTASARLTRTLIGPAAATIGNQRTCIREGAVLSSALRQMLCARRLPLRVKKQTPLGYSIPQPRTSPLEALAGTIFLVGARSRSQCSSSLISGSDTCAQGARPGGVPAGRGDTFGPSSCHTGEWPPSPPSIAPSGPSRGASRGAPVAEWVWLRGEATCSSANPMVRLPPHGRSLSRVTSKNEIRRSVQPSL